MATISDANNHPKGPVTILGSAYVGETLIARPNAIGDADGIDYNSATFQWLRDGTEIPGATSVTYLVSEDDVGANLSIRYTYMDFGGTLETLVSKPEPTVPDVGTPIPDDDAPFNPLAVLGDAIVGARLIARPNGVKDENGIDRGSQSFQWLRDGEIIQGATEQTYTVTRADATARISVEYIYQDLSGAPKSLTSNPKPTVPLPATESPQPGDPDEAEGAVLSGTSDDDILTASLGFNVIDGLDGTDTVLFEGEQSQYTLVLGSDQVSLSDHQADGHGPIFLNSIELIEFGTETPGFDDQIVLENFKSHTDLDGETLEDIIGLYIAYFNRAPDAIGLNFWGTAFANGTSLADIAAHFANQDETRATYTDSSNNEDFATSVYFNVLGRTPDQAGLDFWTHALNGDLVSRDQFILKVLEGAYSDLKPDQGIEFMDQQLADRAYLGNKIDIGAHFAVHRGMSDVTDAAVIMQLFDGSQTSIDTAVAAIDSHYLDAMTPGSEAFLLQLVGVLDAPFMA